MLEYAKQANMPLAIEPLHPAYAADRACVNTTKQALDICDQLDPRRTGALGVALDVYHIWWDPELMPQIARAERIACSRFTSATGWCRQKTSSTTAA
jgi:sugar phosphate isomerase/epimerase